MTQLKIAQLRMVEQLPRQNTRIQALKNNSKMINYVHRMKRNKCQFKCQDSKLTIGQPTKLDKYRTIESQQWTDFNLEVLFRWESRLKLIRLVHPNVMSTSTLMQYQIVSETPRLLLSLALTAIVKIQMVQVTKTSLST